ALKSWDAGLIQLIGFRRLPTGPPVPSRELGHVTWAKAWVTWFLEWRAQREAGSTEQRLPPAPGSGRITGRCHPGSNKISSIDPAGPSLFLILLENFEEQIISGPAGYSKSQKSIKI
ncbi:hypothetical protein I3760_02G139400, partial [Carya illinoinensis]